MSRPTKQYICLVDSYRRPSRKRNTVGRYQVGARDEKEARKFLKDRIGFGSIIVLCTDETPREGAPAGPDGQGTYPWCPHAAAGGDHRGLHGSAGRVPASTPCYSAAEGGEPEWLISCC